MSNAIIFSSGKVKKIDIPHGVAYVKYIDTDDNGKIISKSSKPHWIKNIRLSSYLWRPLASMIYYLDKNDYILCPLYAKKQKGREVFTDDKKYFPELQLGITGKPLYSQTVFDGLRSEIKEETGLLLTIKETNINRYDYKDRKNSKYSIFKINASNTKRSLTRPTKDKYGKDNKKHKIGAVIYGDKISVQKIINELDHLWHNDDKLIGLGMIKVDLIKFFLKNQKYENEIVMKTKFEKY